MNNEQLVFMLRKRIFEEWAWKGLTWKDIKYKYGFSKSWFYKYRQRYTRYGERGLKNIRRNTSFRPHALGLDTKLDILNSIYQNPVHGPNRIAGALNNKISGKAVWGFLKKENLNKKLKRRLWAQSQGKAVLTDKEKHYFSSKHRHIESTMPGELVCMDTFWVNVKNLGRIYQWTACDAYSSYGWAKVYPTKYCDDTVDFLENHILKNTPLGKIKRILTDRGSEFCYTHNGSSNVQLQRACKRHNIIHSVTKPAHPWTNGYAERLNQTIWQEFYLCRLTKPFASLKELQKELDEFMRYYNFRRLHTGYKLKERGFICPAQAFFDLREDRNIVEMTC